MDIKVLSLPISLREDTFCERYRGDDIDRTAVGFARAFFGNGGWMKGRNVFGRSDFS